MHSHSYDAGHVLYLEFHPHEHLQDVQASLSKLEAPALVLEEEIEPGNAR